MLPVIPTLTPYSLDEKARREERRAELVWWGYFGLFVLVVAGVAALGVYLVWRFG